MNCVYQVCIPHTHRDYFDYAAQELAPCIGARVWVPFRNQTRLGIIVNKGQTQLTGTSLKSISAIIDDQPLITKDLLDFVPLDWYLLPITPV